MKARLLKKWGGNYAGQILTNVQPGSIPGDVAEFFEDDDPAVNTVVSQAGANQPLNVYNDSINPEHARAHDEAQRAAAKASKEAISGDAAAALQKVEEQQTQERARAADEFAANRASAEQPERVLTPEQIEANKAGKGPAAPSSGEPAKN